MLYFVRVLAVFLMLVGGTVLVGVLVVTAGRLFVTHLPVYEPGSLAMDAATVLGVGAAVWLLSCPGRQASGGLPV
jgi:hypothetical protein